MIYQYNVKVYCKRLSIALLFTCFSCFSFAWGPIGHRIVGEIASKYLTSRAKKNIANLLGNESMAISSNWPDFVKSDSKYNYLYAWHYVNMEPSLSKTDFMKVLENDTAINAYTKILFIEKELRNKVADRKTQAEYLKLLIHIVGDIHQPLHVGHLEDKGGNTIKVTWFNELSNLHQVWDEKMINFQQLSYTEYVSAINFTTSEERKSWQKEPLNEWFYESYLLADKVYGDIHPDDKLSYNYNFKYIAILNQRLLKAGVRLAGILNEIYN